MPKPSEPDESWVPLLALAGILFFMVLSVAGGQGRFNNPGPDPLAIVARTEAGND